MADTELVVEAQAAKAHEDADQAAAGGTPALYRGVVIDVIYDPALYDPNRWMSAAKEVAGKDKIFKLAPRNSCIVKILNDADKNDIPYTLCFPFFSPHLALPLKPGEQVWVFLENPDDRTKAWGYWMSRVHGPDFVDDVNFTHLDRAFEHITRAGNEQQETSEEDPPEAEPSFPNGDDSNDLS